MPRNHCPPSRRGHTWREPNLDALALLGAAVNRHAIRVCKRCGKLGCVNKQGVIYAVEIP